MTAKIIQDIANFFYKKTIFVIEYQWKAIMWELFSNNLLVFLFLIKTRKNNYYYLTTRLAF